jgi:hypothetical protein
MSDITLRGLPASNPLGYLAALGVLSVCERLLPGQVRMSWTNTVTPFPVLHGTLSIDELVDIVMADRAEWAASFILTCPHDDVKFSRDDLASFVAKCADNGQRSSALCSALVAEGVVDGKGNSKPSDFHFTAGQQKFLAMAKALVSELTPEHVREAICGPWRYESPLPSLKWDVTDDRVYALSATNPASSAKLTVPGAEWLSLLGLTLLPVFCGPKGLLTTGCSGKWKSGEFQWATWSEPLSMRAVETLLAHLPPAPPKAPRATKPNRSLDQAASVALRAATNPRLGLNRVYRATIKRSDQGGYGSFGPPSASTP